MSGDSALRYDELARASGGLGESHWWLVHRVPAGATVLDCGCAGGFVAGVLADRGCVVDGVEIDSAAAIAAEGMCRHVFVGSLESESFISNIEGTYDRILCGDVLEHLRAPEDTLCWLATRLNSNGRLLVSIPNVAYWGLRWSLLRGRFTYQDSGLLDRTHLRFYTYHGIRALVAEAGFRIVSQDCTLRLPLRFGGRLIRPLMKCLPNLFAYQILLELEPCATSA